jgi:hypothetical protein
MFMHGKHGVIESQIQSARVGAIQSALGVAYQSVQVAVNQIGPGGGKSLLRDRSRGLNTDTMRPYRNPYSNY